MIDLQKVMKLKVSHEVLEFMQSSGNNHVSLYKGWQENPRMREDRALLEQQLAVVLSIGVNYDLAKRILGRLRRVDHEHEDRQLDRRFVRGEDKTTAPLAELDILG